MVRAGFDCGLSESDDFPPLPAQVDVAPCVSDLLEDAAMECDSVGFDDDLFAWEGEVCPEWSDGHLRAETVLHLRPLPECGT